MTNPQEGVYLLLLCSLLPTFHIPSVLCTPDVSPAKEHKESEFWKMLHEPEEQAAVGEEAQAGVRMASLMSLGSGFGMGRVPQAKSTKQPPRLGMKGYCLRSMKGEGIEPSCLSLPFPLSRRTGTLRLQKIQLPTLPMVSELCLL